MKNLNFLPIILLATITMWTIQKVHCQTPDFTDTLNIGQTFTSDTTIYPFTDQTISGIAADGSVQFNSYTSYVRILITDDNGDQFIIFETYPLLDTIWNFNFSTKCDETRFLNNFHASSINFQVLDATITLNNLEYTEAPLEGADQLQYNAKLANDLDKIDRVNAFLVSKQMIWRAGVTEYSKMFYKDRLDPYSGLAKFTYGFEYYIGGVFEIYGKSGDWDQPSYDIAPRFDWRSRHGADEENTPYYDGDLTGSGWMTELKCQTGCWVESTEEWLCISEEECSQLGGNWRPTGACTGFATISTVEGFANLYYNQHVDFDLSEQQLASPPMVAPFDNCAGIMSGGEVYENYDIFVDYGVIGEADFPFRGVPVPCNQQQYAPDENVSLAGYQIVSQGLNPEMLKKLLIEHGPITWTRLLPFAPNHALTLVGFDILNVGDKYTFGYNQILEVPERFSRTDVPIWILKDNYGLDSRLDGYFYVILDQDGPAYVSFPDNDVENAIISLNYSDDDILIRDEDNDGYLNWGIGNCEECSGERDGDDHDASIGPMDENGFCTIIDSYSTSFEGKTYENWRQVDGDSFDWLKHNSAVYGNGPDGAYDGDFYFVMEGAYDPNNVNPYNFAILESPTIDLDDECLFSLNFHYFRYFLDGGLQNASKLLIQTSANNGETWNQVWSSNNPQNNTNWH